MATVENRMEVSQKTKNRTTLSASNSPLGYISGKKKIKDTNSKRNMHPNVHSSVIYNCHDTEATWVSMNRWVDEDVVYIYIHIHMYTHTHTHTLEYYSVIKRMKCSHLEGIMQSQTSQRKTHTIWYHLYVGSEEYNKPVNITAKSRLTDIENKWVVTTGQEWQYKDGGGEVQATGYMTSSRMYCTTRGIPPTFCNNGQWKLTFKKDIKIKKLFFNWKKEKKKSNGLLITPASGPR